MKIEPWQLNQRQSLSLDEKIIFSQRRIEDWYNYWEGQVYVSFSGGKDSTVLLHLVRSLFPEVPAVFSNTGLEYPEILDFIKSVDNVTWIKPKISFLETINKYGYPVISKKVAMGCDRFRNTKSDYQKNLRLYGGIALSSGKKQHPTISKKWHYLTDAPFKISEKCCEVMKKRPFSKYNKSTGRKPFIGTMADDSYNRRQTYLKTGCNAFNIVSPTSTPLSIWSETDIWEYIKTNQIAYSRIYDMGETNTGCVFCCFGVHMETGDNRFIRMRSSHPKLYNYCMNVLQLDKVLDYINISY